MIDALLFALPRKLNAKYNIDKTLQWWAYAVWWDILAHLVFIVVLVLVICWW